LFDSLENNQIESLMRSHKLARFGRGERIIEQGEPGHSMYILSRGTAKVVVKHNHHESVIKMLEEGDCFGEMSLLTGAARAATIIAETDCEVIEIGKSALRELLLQNPRLAENLSETVTNRRVELEAGMIPADQGTDAKTRPDNKEGFLFRLRQFFEL
jgi:CRP-like cAMP-binding protein